MLEFKFRFRDRIVLHDSSAVAEGGEMMAVHVFGLAYLAGKISVSSLSRPPNLLPGRLDLKGFVGVVRLLSLPLK